MSLRGTKILKVRVKIKFPIKRDSNVFLFSQREPQFELPPQEKRLRFPKVQTLVKCYEWPKPPPAPLLQHDRIDEKYLNFPWAMEGVAKYQTLADQYKGGGGICGIFDVWRVCVE